MNENYNLYSKFNIEQHKQTFINYFEAIILPSGEVQYATPSHIEKLMALTNEPREIILEKMPITASPIEWLIDYTGCIAVWKSFHKGTPVTVEQKDMLQLLIVEGLIK
jgi:hypothetical protein